VYEDADEELASPKVLSSLRELHAGGTLHKIDRAYLAGNILLKYAFGVTIYPELGCAVAPIPSSRSYDDYLQAVAFSPVHGTSLSYADTTEDPGNFRGHVTATQKTVDDLASAFAALRRHPALEDV